MAKDAFIRNARCAYCGRPATLAWGGDLETCDHEVCKALGYAEQARRLGHHRREQAPPARIGGGSQQRSFLRARTVPLASKGHSRHVRG